MNDIQLNQRHHRHRSHAAACNMVKEHQRPTEAVAVSVTIMYVIYWVGAPPWMEMTETIAE